MSSYAFARRPSWILRHVLIVVLVVVMVNLGLWQLRRLDEKRDRNALVEARGDEPVAQVEDVVSSDDPLSVGDELRYRRVTAAGTYDVADQVLVRNRSFQEAPGSWVLTPLVLDDGSAIVVNRGWVPVTGELPLDPSAAPPGGPVTVQGTLQQTEVRGSFGPRDPAEGRLDTLSRVDLARLQRQIDAPLLPVWLELTDQDPPPGDQPTYVEPPVLDEGPHFSYAVQWFIFSTIAVIGYPLILRRKARTEAVEDASGREDLSSHTNDRVQNPVP